MSRSAEQSVPGEGRDWSLSYGEVLLHDAHISRGKSTSPGCGLCREGLAGAMEAIPSPGAGDKPTGVAPGDGVDKKGDAPPSRSDWASDRESQVLEGKV